MQGVSGSWREGRTTGISTSCWKTTTFHSQSTFSLKNSINISTFAQTVIDVCTCLIEAVLRDRHGDVALQILDIPRLVSYTSLSHLTK